MTITPLPTPAPSRLQSQTEFSANVNAFVGALPTLVTQINAMAPDIDAAGANAATATAKAAEAAASAASAQATAAAVQSAAGLPSLTGNAGKALLVNSGAGGVEWAFPEQTDYQAFTASGTWTKPANVTMVYVECVGAGGGGANLSSFTGSYPGGGAGGGFASGVFLASVLASTVTVTVGAFGAGKALGSSGLGAAGGSSTFGSHLIAFGGRGGTSSPNSVGVTNTGSSAATVDTGNAFTWQIDGSGGGLGANTQVGGDALFGGGGGGGYGTAGGVSRRHGNGGAGVVTAGVKGGNGVAPGGGGGCSGGNGGGGDGARGEIRIWAW